MQITDRIEIDGHGVSREVQIYDGPSQALLTSAQSAASGEFTATIPADTDSVFLVVCDNPGQPFQPLMAYTPGQRVRPDLYRGLVFDVYVAGTADALPTWPTQAGELVTSGSVIFKAVPFYRPVVKFKPL